MISWAGWDHGAMGPWSHGAPWSGKGGGGGKGGKGGGAREGGEGGHALGTFRVQSREAMGAMGDGTMEPWGHEPFGRAEAAEKADEKVQGREAVGAMGQGTNEAMERGGKGGGGGNHMERHGAGRAEGAEREGRGGGKGGEGGVWAGWDHGAMGP